MAHIGDVKVGEWIKYDWQTWRQVADIRARTQEWIFFRLVGYPIECSCAPDVEFPWSPV